MAGTLPLGPRLLQELLGLLEGLLLWARLDCSTLPLSLTLLLGVPPLLLWLECLGRMVSLEIGPVGLLLLELPWLELLPVSRAT